MKYTKKPVTIEAVQWKDGKISEVLPWVKEALDKDINTEVGAIMRVGNEVHIKTLEGIMTAIDGDFIIKGVKGELYPCKPDIFAW